MEESLLGKENYVVWLGLSVVKAFTLFQRKLLISKLHDLNSQVVIQIKIIRSYLRNRVR